MANPKALAGKASKTAKWGKKEKVVSYMEVLAPKTTIGDFVDVDLRMLPPDVRSRFPPKLAVIRMTRMLAKQYGQA